MGFPVLRLSSLVFDNVYKFLDIPDIIVFSQCSRSMKAIVKSKESPSKRYCLYVPIGAHKTCVRLTKHNDRPFKFLFTWILCKNEKPTWDADRVISNDGARIGAVELTMREEEDEWNTWVKKDYYEKKLLAITELLKDIFHCTIVQVSLYENAGASFRKLFIESDKLHVVDTIEFYHDTCTQEEMTFLLDHFTVNWLILKTDCGPGFSYSKPLKQYPRLELKNSRWLNLDHLLNLTKTAIFLELENADMITDKDLNQFIKWWIGSDNKQLKVVYLNRSNGDRDRTVIMEGIQSTPARAKRRNEISYCGFISEECYDKGLDICRKDGVQATVMVENTWFALGVLKKQNRGSN